MTIVFVTKLCATKSFTKNMNGLVKDFVMNFCYSQIYNSQNLSQNFQIRFMDVFYHFMKN